MSGHIRFEKLVYFPGLPLGCLIFGWMIPIFFDWPGNSHE